MSLLSIPLRYLRVKWTRTLLLLCIFALGVASMSALREVSQVVGDSFEKKLISYGANILITPHQDSLKVSYGGYTLGNVALETRSLRLSEALQAIDGIALRANLAILAPKLLSVVQVQDQSVGLVGVNWDEETTLKTYWDIQEGEWPTEQSALLGSAAAARLGIGPGDSVRVNGRDIVASGVLRQTGSDDDNVIFLSLPFLQELTGRLDEADFMEVAALCSGCPIEDIVAELEAALPGQDVLALRQVAESRMFAVHFAQNLTFSVSLVILVTACTTVFMAMLSAVSERRKEIGIMRSVGFSRGDVFLVFSLEALLVGLMAGATGFGLGRFMAEQVLMRLHLLDDMNALPPFSPVSFMFTALLVGVVAASAALFPAWKASRVEPTEVLTLA